MNSWKVNEAKSKFSELIRVADSEPQFITSHGREVAVVLSMNAYAELTQPQKNLAIFLLEAPLSGDSELIIERDSTDRVRAVDL